MKTKVAIKSDNISTFGGVFYVMDDFSSLGTHTLIDRLLGLRRNAYSSQQSKIISSLMNSHCCSSNHIEGIGFHLGHHVELRLVFAFIAPDTVLGCVL
ncbi:MAG: hypothetical protein ACK5KP_09305 [Paludibacteraceae bacterium]